MRRLYVLLGVLSISAATAGATQIILYDGSLGTPPEEQGWLAYENPILFGTADRTVAGGTTRVDTTASDGIRAGFANHTVTEQLVNPAFPVLDRSEGFMVGIDLLIHSESHASQHRAGFSIIALGHDNRGVELGFWEDQVWAQIWSEADSDLQRGEGSDFDTTAAMQRYELSILGDDYWLTADGTEILSGTVKDYSAWQPPLPGLPNPYGIPSFLFFGDNTGSAGADFEIARITVIPEPAALGAILLAGVVGLLHRRGRGRRISR